MQKLSTEIIARLTAEKAVNKEIDFMIYISSFQDSRGKICGVHYRTLCEKMGMSFQTFYNVKQSLEERGYIRCRKSGCGDYDITILGNSEQECIGKGYVNTNHNMFRQKEFRQLRAGEKLLAMYLMQITRLGKGHFEIKTENFYEKYRKKFGVSRRVLRSYLMRLKTFFSIGIKDRKYYITPKKNLYRRDGEVSENRRFKEFHVDVILRRLRIRNTAERDREELMTLFDQYRERLAAVGKQAMESIEWAVRESIEKLNGDRRRIEIRELKPSLVHKILIPRVEKLEAEYRIQMNRNF